MPLLKGEYLGIRFGRRVCVFTMRNVGEPVTFVASWELMDDLAGGVAKKNDQRDAQFVRLRPQLEEIAQRRYNQFPDDQRPQEIILTAQDRRLLLR